MRGKSASRCWRWQSMVMISPAAAPVLGALLLRFTLWEGIFAVQAILSVIVVVGSILFRETLGERSAGSVFRAVGRLGVVLKNPAFTALLIIFSSISVATMAFVSSSSYIYQDIFGQSSEVYSYFFTFNAAGLILGPYIYIRLAARFPRFSIVTACFAVMGASGLLVWTLGGLGPWAFALALMPATLAGSCLRPPGAFMMLDRQAGDTGSAASLMTAGQTAMGSVGMLLISLDAGSLVQIVGVVTLLCGLLCGGLWLGLSRRPFLRGVREQ